MIVRNRCDFIGYVSDIKDYSDKGLMLVTVCTNEHYFDQNKNEKVEYKNYHRCTTWNKNIFDYIRNDIGVGDIVNIESKHRTKRYRDSDQEEWKYREEFIFTQIQKENKSVNPIQQTSSNHKVDQQKPLEEDDLPF